MESFTTFKPLYNASPIGLPDNERFNDDLKEVYPFKVRSFEKPAFIAPTFLEIDILLSLKIMIILRFSTPISFNASKDKPLLIAPSPITGIIL